MTTEAKPKQFVYLRRERQGARQKFMWLALSVNSMWCVSHIMPMRLKHDAVKAIKAAGYIILPDGLTGFHYLALEEFAKEHGPLWKSILKEWWVRGLDENRPSLRQIRNIFGAGRSRCMEV